MAEYNLASRETETLDLSFIIGDSFPFEIRFPFDLSEYSVIAKIKDMDIATTKSGSSLSLLITKQQSATLSQQSPWYLKLEKGTQSITYVKGKFIPL
jgi:hypothetical protein